AAGCVLPPTRTTAARSGVRPCRCRGSTKWVHQTCLQRWVDEKQRGNSTARVACPQCNAEYLIVFPTLGPVVYVLDLADRLISKAGPFAAAGIMVGSIYWTAVHLRSRDRHAGTASSCTTPACARVCVTAPLLRPQVVGHKEGLDVMERADPLFLLIGLPTIPVMLILGKMIRWEDYVLRLWRKYSSKLQILNSIFPGIGCPVPRIPAEASPLADHVSATRVLCGALVFPTIATIVGKLMFSSVNSNLQRTILVGRHRLRWPSKAPLRCTSNSSSTCGKPTARSSTSPSRRRLEGAGLRTQARLHPRGAPPPPPGDRRRCWGTPDGFGSSPTSALAHVLFLGVFMDPLQTRCTFRKRARACVCVWVCVCVLITNLVYSQCILKQQMRDMCNDKVL
ncbi:unnamed protein product, partial [Tetraodon nigroviridis]